jgi:hypothetical protein
MSSKFTSAGYWENASLAFPGTGSHTLMLWMHCTSDDTGDCIDLWDGSSYTNCIVIGCNAGQNVGFFESNGGVSATFNTTYTLSTWFHVACTYDGTNVVTYFNGVQVDSRAFSATARPTLARISIGLGAASRTQQDVMVFTSALSANEIRACMNGRIPRVQRANLACWYPLHNDGPTIDYSAKGLTLGTVGGTPAAGTVWAPTNWSGMQQRALRVFLNTSALAVNPGTTQTTGAASMTSSAGLAAAGTTQTTGSAVVGITYPIVAAGTTQTTGSAAVAKTAGFVAAGTTQTTGSATLTAAASLVAAGTTQTTGAAAMTAAAALAAAGTTNTTGAATLTAAAGLVATGTTQTNASAAVLGAQSAVGTTQTTGSASLTAAAAIAGAGTTQTTGAASLVSAAQLVAAGTTQTTATAAMTIAYLIAATGTTQTTGVAVLAGAVAGGGGGDDVASRRWLGALGARRRLRR